MDSIFASFLQELTITQTRKKYLQCGMPNSPDLNRSKELPAKDIVPRFTEGRKGGSARFSQIAAPEWQSWDVHPRLPDSKLFLTVPGCTSGKLSHAGTSPAGYGGRESRRCRPPQPMPTPGRPPGHPPELTLGVRAATNSPPPLRETAPASGATYLVVPAARPAGSSTAASGTARHARDAASSSGPSDFQAAHFQAASREASWEL